MHEVLIPNHADSILNIVQVIVTIHFYLNRGENDFFQF